MKKEDENRLVKIEKMLDCALSKYKDDYVNRTEFNLHKLNFDFLEDRIKNTSDSLRELEDRHQKLVYDVSDCQCDIRQLYFLKVMYAFFISGLVGAVVILFLR